MPPKKTTQSKTAAKGKPTKSAPDKSSGKGAQEKKAAEGGKATVAEAIAPPVEVSLKEISKILYEEGNDMKKSGRWPLFIDTSERVSTFLRYRDTNYVNTVDPSHMQTDRLRLALLGALWFGKPFVLDMGEVDMFNTVTEKLDEVEKGLMESVMDRSILNEDKILKLVRPSDGEEYEAIRLDETKCMNFQLVITTAVPPTDTLARRMYVMQIPE